MLKDRINKPKFIHLIFPISVYFFVLSLVYRVVLVQHFSYQGYESVGGIISFICGLFFINLCLFVMPKMVNRPSEFVSWLIFLIVVIPAVIVNVSFGDMIFVDATIFFAILFIALFALSVVSSFRLIGLNYAGLNSNLFFICIFIFLLFSYFSLFYIFGFRMPPSLFDVYDVRLGAREILSASNFGQGYLLRALSNVINPLLLIFGLLKRNYFFVLLAIMGQFAIYTFDGTKSTLLSVFLLIGLYYLLGREAKVIHPVTLVKAFFIVVAFCFFIDFIFFDNSWLLTQLFSRRFLIVPGHLTGLYYEFFNNNPFFYWGGMPGFDFIYQGYVSPGFLLGDYLYSKVEGNVNANYIADGYANFGFIGVFVVAFFLSFFLWVFDSASRNKPFLISILILSMPIVSLSNTGLLSSMFSHGLILSLFVVFFIPTNSIKNS